MSVFIYVCASSVEYRRIIRKVQRDVMCHNAIGSARPWPYQTAAAVQPRLYTSTNAIIISHSSCVHCVFSFLLLLLFSFHSLSIHTCVQFMQCNAMQYARAFASRRRRIIFCPILLRLICYALTWIVSLVLLAFIRLLLLLLLILPALLLQCFLLLFCSSLFTSNVFL